MGRAPFLSGDRFEAVVSPSLDKLTRWSSPRILDLADGDQRRHKEGGELLTTDGVSRPQEFHAGGIKRHARFRLLPLRLRRSRWARRSTFRTARPGTPGSAFRAVS